MVQAGLTASGFDWAFTTFTAANWHPLTWLSHMLDCQLFGLDAGAHHLVNVAFHLANSVLLFLICARMTRRPWRSLVVAGRRQPMGHLDRRNHRSRAGRDLPFEATQRRPGPQVERDFHLLPRALARVAQTVVGKLMDLYLVEHGVLNRTHGSLKFFTEQAARAHEKLIAAEKEFREFRSATGLVSPADERKALSDRVSRLQDDLLAAEAARAVSEAKLRHLRQELSQLPQRQVTAETQGFGNEGVDRMREQLYALQVKREEAAAKYTPDHPAMRQIEEQLAAAQEVFNRQTPTRTQVTTAENPLVRQALDAAFAEEHALATCQAKVDAIRSQLAGAQQAVEAFNQQEIRLAGLQREVDLKQTSYRTYATTPRAGPGRSGPGLGAHLEHQRGTSGHLRAEGGPPEQGRRPGGRADLVDLGSGGRGVALRLERSPPPPPAGNVEPGIGPAAVGVDPPDVAPGPGPHHEWKRPIARRIARPGLPMRLFGSGCSGSYSLSLRERGRG